MHHDSTRIRRGPIIGAPDRRPRMLDLRWPAWPRTLPSPARGVMATGIDKTIRTTAEPAGQARHCGWCPPLGGPRRYLACAITATGAARWRRP